MLSLEPDWYKKAQIYSITVFSREDSEKFGITVNGLWNGYIGNTDSPFAFGRLLLSYYENSKYDSDKKFVDELHKRGYIVPATILTTQGHSSFQRTEFNKLSCKSFKGDLPDWDLKAGSKFMCSNNSRWLDWMVMHGKKAIDSGADLIVLDEIQGGGFIPLYQWYSQYLGAKEPGFCEHCISGFRSFLKNKYSSKELKEFYEIDDINLYDLKSRIYDTINLKYFDRVKKDPLIEEYIEFNEENNYYLKRSLVSKLKEYAEKKNKEIIISANSYSLGSVQLGDYWVKGLIFSDFLDFYTFENHYAAKPMEKIVAYPRNKWIAWEKLAYNATGERFVSLIDTGTNEEINRQFKEYSKNFSNYLYIHFMEAYINRGAFGIYYGKFYENFKLWERCANAAAFIKNHRYLYEGEQETDSKIAILFLYSENLRSRYFSYLGLSQALSESNMAYDVIFGGGGKYLKDRVEPDILRKYELLIIPNSKDILSSQIVKIKNFVKNGGKAIVFSGTSFGFSGKGEKKYGKGSFFILDSWSYENRVWDIGSLYFFSYEDKYRKAIKELLLGLTDSYQILKNAKRKIVATVYFKKKKKMIILHLLNYDHNIKTDVISEKNGIEIRVKKPDFDVNNYAYLISPDFNEKIIIKTRSERDFILLNVPILKVYDLIVIGGKKGNIVR